MSAHRLNDILDLFAYDEWAAGRTLEAASRLSAEQLAREVGGSFPSVLKTLAHVLHADWIWLSRWQGVSPTGWPEEWSVTDFASLQAHRRRIAADRKTWLAGLVEDDLERVVDYRNIKGEPFRSTLNEMMRHVVNHATYHRGQVTNLIRAVGGKPIGTDMITWFRERTAVVAAERLRA